MEINEISKRYKNQSILIFIISTFLLLIFPLILYLFFPIFSGFGFIIVNSQHIIRLHNVSYYLSIFGGIIPFSILITSMVTGLNRDLMLKIYPLLFFFIIYGLIIYFILVGILSLLLIFFFLNEILNFNLVFVGFGVVLTLGFFTITPAIQKGLSNFIKLNDKGVIGVKLNKSDHSKVFDFINIICERLKVAMPKNIILGLSTDFYVTVSKIKLFNGLKINNLKNETLYISLPLMRVLNQEEFASIIGHELAHLEGRDNVYTLKFLPTRRRLNDQLKELDKIKGKNILHEIAIYPVIFLFNEFERKIEKITKLRELKADEIGAKSGSASALIISLAKLYFYELVWEDALEEYKYFSKSDKKTNIINLSKNFLKISKKSFKDYDFERNMPNIYKYEQKHPSDTHPSLLERMNNLKVNKSEITNIALFNFTPSSISLIDNAEIIEENLTQVLNIVYKHSN